jgi:hypothetical protein
VTCPRHVTCGVTCPRHVTCGVTCPRHVTYGVTCHRQAKVLHRDTTPVLSRLDARTRLVFASTRLVTTSARHSCARLLAARLLARPLHDTSAFAARLILPPDLSPHILSGGGSCARQSRAACARCVMLANARHGHHVVTAQVVSV